MNEDIPVDYEWEKISRAQEGILGYLDSLTPYERTNKLNALAHNTWPERKARGHLKHTELGITDHKELTKEAQGVIQSPDRVMIFFSKDGHLQYAFAKGGNDWRIAVIDADTQQIKTFYGPKKKNLLLWIKGLLKEKEVRDGLNWSGGIKNEAAGMEIRGLSQWLCNRGLPGVE